MVVQSVLALLSPSTNRSMIQPVMTCIRLYISRRRLDSLQVIVQGVIISRLDLFQNMSRIHIMVKGTFVSESHEHVSIFPPL
jgi:hypothetical protein